MERLIRVGDHKELPSGFKVFLGLPDLLPVFEPEAHAWTWALQQEPEVNGVREGFDLHGSMLEDKIEADPEHGLRMSFDDLHRYARGVHQVIWGEFIAAETPAALPLMIDDAATVGQRAVAGLAAIDSAFWIVGGPAHIIERATARFGVVEELAVDEWSARTADAPAPR
jgi:hypothetical protein